MVGNQNLLQNILKSSIDGIFTLDENQKIISWNPQMERFSGKKQKDCIGNFLVDLFPAFKDDALDRKLKKVLKGHFQVVKGLPFNQVLQNGITDFYEGYYSPLTNEQDKVIGILGVIREVGLRPFHHEKRLQLDQKSEDEDHSLNLLNLQNVLKKHEELARIVSKSPAVAFSCKLDHRRTVKFISENINQFGYSKEDFSNGKIGLSDIIDAENIEQWKKSFDSYINGDLKENFLHEYKIVSHYGNNRWVQERSWLLKDPDKQEVYLEGLLVDVSVRKFAEEALLASKEHFKLFFEKAPIGMAIISDQNEIFKVNESFCRITGYEEHELINQPIESIIFSEDLEVGRLMDKELFAQSRQSYKLEKRWITKGNRVIHTIEQGALLQNPLQELHKLIQIVDISDRKKAETELIDSENRLNQAQAFAQLGNWEYFPANRKLILSDEVFKIFRLEKSEKVDADHIGSFLLSDDLQNLQSNFKNFLQEEDAIFEFEFKIRRADGIIRVVYVKGNKVKDASDHLKVFGFIQDITERKKIEDDLKVRNAELNNFVYKVSHDLRAPLLSTIGLLNLAKLSESSEHTKYLEMIENRIKRLDDFISDILSHSKNLYTTVLVENIDLEKMIQKCFQDLSYLKNSAKIKYTTEIKGGEFFSDSQRVKDIIKNLMSNSILYLNPSKEEHFIHIDIETDEKFMKMVFEDNGLGIEPTVLPKIYDMFYRGIEISNGSGIGLYIVKQTLEKLHGEISVESYTRVGTKFFVKIPNLIHQQSEIGQDIKAIYD